jgi:hypothetical protein
MAWWRALLTLDIPGWCRQQPEALLQNVNGILTLDGELPGWGRTLAKGSGWRPGHAAHIRGHVRTPRRIAACLACRRNGWRLETRDGQNAEVVRQLGAERVVAIGNRANDTDVLRVAALDIAAIGSERLARDGLTAEYRSARDRHAHAKRGAFANRSGQRLREKQCDTL